MASPFTIFRKHQKVLIVVLGLMAMVAFVFLPIILKSIQSGGQPGNPTVVTTDQFGDLKERQLRNLLGQRQVVLQFVQRAASKAAGQPIPFQYVERFFGPISEESVVQSWVLRQYAREMGMQISNGVINQFIRSVTAEQVSGDELAAIAKEMKVSETRLFEALRNELTSLYFERLYFATPDSVGVALTATTPAERWGYFERLNRKATTQMVAVPVEQFVSKVADPDEKVLEEFFEKYKTDYANPLSPEPGFHEPRRVKVEYVIAKRNAFDDPKAVTDEEIKEYYEANKDRFYVRLALPGVLEDDTTPKMELPKTELPKEEPAKEEPKMPATEKPADTKPAEKPAEAKPAETPAKEAPKAAEKPAETKPAEPVKTEKPAEAEKPKTPAESKPATPPEKKPEESKPADAKPAETPKPDEKSNAAGQSVFRLVSETSAAETPAAEGATAKPDDDAKPDTAKSDGAEPAPAAGSAEKIEYIPLEEVKEEIRQTLAREQAATRMDNAFAPIREKMAQYRDKWIVAAATVADEEGEEDDGEETVEVKGLPRPDVAAMAKKANLEFEKTSWIDRNDAEKLSIAKSTLGGTSYFIPVVFDDRYPEFRPGISEDMEGNRYLFWIVAEKPERVPEFDDKGVREQVLQAWKMIEARKLAKKEAESLIEKAKKADKSLKGEFGGKPGFEVLQPKDFSWLTRGLLPSVTSQPARISPVEGVRVPGPDFMKAVFALSKGEFGVAMNNPQTIAYAVEMIDLKPSQKVLWELFRVDDFGKYADAGINDQRERITTWRKDLEEEAGLKWERKPKPHESRR